MANAKVVFNHLGSKQPKNWESEKILLNSFLEDCDGKILSIVKLSKIDMTEPVLTTEASEEFKASTETKEVQKFNVDKETEKDKLNCELNTEHYTK